MAHTMLILNGLKRRIEILTNPYWLKDNIYIGTVLNSDEERAYEGNDVFIFNGSVRELINRVRLIGNKTGSIKVKRPSDDYEMGMTVMNGYCSIISNGFIYSMFVFFEDRVKTMENMIIRKDIYDGAYHITSKFTLEDKVYYSTTVPKGKSYDDITKTLKSLGAATSETISEYLGVDRNRVSGRLTEMERCGLVKRHGYSKSKFDKACILWELA